MTHLPLKGPSVADSEVGLICFINMSPFHYVLLIVKQIEKRILYKAHWLCLCDTWELHVSIIKCADVILAYYPSFIFYK